MGVTLAFNTIGWQAQNVLFAAIDALVPPGYATTHGYNDPQYPLTGRVPR